MPDSIAATQSAGHEWTIDEIYVGVDRFGLQFVLPVQAKGGSDTLSTVQTRQDIACCAGRLPQLICRPISAQFIAGDLIALFELVIQEGSVQIIEERHYRLMPTDEISPPVNAAASRVYNSTCIPSSTTRFGGSR